MITQNGYDFTFRTALFSVSGSDEIASLPTTTTHSIVGGKLYEPVAAGSFAFLTDGSGKKYVLDGKTDTWKETA